MILNCTAFVEILECEQRYELNCNGKTLMTYMKKGGAILLASAVNSEYFGNIIWAILALHILLRIESVCSDTAFGFRKL